jgi:Fe-S cluster biogenesis protein NfuA
LKSKDFARSEVLDVGTQTLQDKIKELLLSVVAPLVEKDGAELYLVRAEGSDVVLHFAGTYAGCPGVGVVTKNIIAPVLKPLIPDVVVTVNSGLPVPKGAERLTPPNGKR